MIQHAADCGAAWSNLSMVERMNKVCCMLSIAAFLRLASLSLYGQESVDIQIRLVDGLNGKPMTGTEVGVEDSTRWVELHPRTDDHGYATLHIQKGASIIVHNTKQYVTCSDEGGRTVRRQFSIREILSTGFVQNVSPPNKCHTTSATPIPGKLMLFVRPWELLEQTF